MFRCKICSVQILSVHLLN